MKIVLASVLVLGSLVAVNAGLNKSEVVECNQWKAQAVEFKGFYLTQWQADQCAAHNIEINAVIK